VGELHAALERLSRVPAVAGAATSRTEVDEGARELEPPA
jgi:hypothetical protein